MFSLEIVGPCTYRELFVPGLRLSAGWWWLLRVYFELVRFEVVTCSRGGLRDH